MYELPKEYLALVYLRLGCALSTEYACRIWTSLNQKDTLRVKDVIESKGEIVLTGFCSDIEEILRICNYLTAIGVLVRYEKTWITLEI